MVFGIKNGPVIGTELKAYEVFVLLLPEKVRIVVFPDARMLS